MSVCYTIVNVAKQQYFDIEAFGEWDNHPLRASNNSDGHCLHAFALTLLLIHPSSFNNKLLGAWSGDSIFFPSDHSEADESGFSFGVYTATVEDRVRSLYSYSHEVYTDISSDVIAAICDWDDNYLRILVNRAMSEKVRPYRLCCLLLELLRSDSDVSFSFRYLYEGEGERIIADLSRFVSEFAAQIEQ